MTTKLDREFYDKLESDLADKVEYYETMVRNLQRCLVHKASFDQLLQYRHEVSIANNGDSLWCEVSFRRDCEVSLEEARKKLAEWNDKYSKFHREIEPNDE